MASSDPTTSRRTKCWAAQEASQPLQLVELDAPPLGPNDVELKILACGLCHSDLHIIEGEWGGITAPQVCGHEGIGEVTAVGSNVSRFAIGDRAGLGWLTSPCSVSTCEWCSTGRSIVCDGSIATCYGPSHGAFCDYWRGDSRLLVKIPEQLGLNEAPMLCGGITVYTPIRDYTKPSDRVGVLGVGGLGHFAIKFARARGSHVVGLSTSSSKRDEVIAMGAHEFFDVNDETTFSELRNRLDAIIITCPADLDFTKYVNLLRPFGTLVIVALHPNPISIPALPLLAKYRRVVGSCTGTVSDAEEMLEFAVRHNIQTVAEVFKFEDINAALDRLRSNRQRYRIVLVHDT